MVNLKGGVCCYFMENFKYNCRINFIYLGLI